MAMLVMIGASVTFSGPCMAGAARDDLGVQPGHETTAPSGWSIVLGSVAVSDPVDDSQRLAASVLDRVRKGKLPEARMERRGRSFVIFFGNYATPDSDEAKGDVQRVREIDIEGAHPYSKAYLAPPPDEALKGSMPEYDLRNAKKLFGAEQAYYTLQVGIYGNADGTPPKPDALKEARATAEKAVMQLRRDGEMAFYFHGPTRSTVTVGLFGVDDLKQVTNADNSVRSIEPAELANLRQLHPNNLLNGEGIKERVNTSDLGAKPVFRTQPSVVVKVPDSSDEAPKREPKGDSVFGR